MSKIFELYGYRLDCWNETAENNLKRVWCPFIDGECDGGGNRYLSAINVKSNANLSAKIKGKDIIQAGVCSLQIHENEQPWIVCPRRLLSLKNGNLSAYQACVRKKLSEYSELEKTKTYKAWSEVKIKTEISTGDNEMKSFNYTFDYVIAATERKKIADIASSLSCSPKMVKKTAEENGYTVVYRDAEYWIDDFPADPFIIIEVMTSSTSGGNKKKRTQIAMACEDAILNGMGHNAPGINYRQVWARMVSQLIVKSQVALAWNGRTIWLVQDVLADYISKSTALVLPEYLSEKLDEVNILSVRYGDAVNDKTTELIELKEARLFSGPISSSSAGEKTKGFIDIVKIGVPPPKAQIWKTLLHKKPLGNWKVE
ncbi:MAG: hypothetical protein LBT00_01880 [Spirochaetaceae bacterium]|jgi:hypothetical protein|nr:hypothetical protein [Spirochaetaceae bacterium]